MTVPHSEEKSLKTVKPKEELQEFEAGPPTSQLPKEPKAPKMEKPKPSLNQAKLDKLTTKMSGAKLVDLFDTKNNMTDLLLQPESPARPERPALHDPPCMEAKSDSKKATEAKPMRDDSMEGKPPAINSSPSSFLSYTATAALVVVHRPPSKLHTSSKLLHITRAARMSSAPCLGRLAISPLFLYQPLHRHCSAAAPPGPRLIRLIC